MVRRVHRRRQRPTLLGGPSTSHRRHFVPFEIWYSTKSPLSFTSLILPRIGTSRRSPRSGRCRPSRPPRRAGPRCPGARCAWPRPGGSRRWCGPWWRRCVRAQGRRLAAAGGAELAQDVRHVQAGRLGEITSLLAMSRLPRPAIAAAPTARIRSDRSHRRTGGPRPAGPRTISEPSGALTAAAGNRPRR
jgi:hypothetical protein